VSENIFMYKPARMGNGAEIMGVSEVCNKYGIERPQQVIDILGLWGDAADNIPGIPGVGEVTACKLLARFGSIENLIEQADEIENPKLKEKVKTHANQAIESKKLATIILDVPIDFSEEKLKICSPNVTDTTALLEELEMRSFASRLLAYYTGEKEGKKNISKVNTDLDVIEIQSKKVNKTVEDKQIDLFSDNREVEMSLVEVAVSARKEKAEKWDTVEKLQKGLLALRNGGGNIAFYLFPSNKENYCSSHILCAAFSDEEGHLFYYIPESVSNLSVLEKQAFSCFFEENDFLKSKQGEASFSFANLLAERSPKPLLITYNLKEQLHLLWGENLTFNASVFCGFDVMLAHYVIDPESGHDLKRMVENYSFASMVDFSAEEYSLWVVENLVSLQLILSKKMKEVEAETLFREVEMPLTFVLADMERVGVRLDTQRLKQYGEELSLKIQEIEQKIYTLAGVMFNIASPKQLGEILYEKLELTDKPKHTKTKKWSTAEDVLQKLVHKHPIVALVLEYRSLAKLKSTYVDALPLLVDPNSGHLHTTYNQAVTSTGRLSSQNPNLQNIPIRTQMGKEIRKSFVADKAGNVLLAADYSQIELRIIAQLSQDKTMLEDFIEHKDIHTATAAKVFNVSMAEVDQTMRRAAKMVNFGILYGISAFGLAERLNVSRKESAELIEKYFEKYSGLKHYMDAAISIAKEKGYVETLLHRRRYVKDINSGNALVRSYAERNAINAPIQGSSADMIKVAMIRIFNT
ncbi:MAG: DNA polymerase I, partial [Bacteroidales bacterium]